MQSMERWTLNVVDDDDDVPDIIIQDIGVFVRGI